MTVSSILLFVIWNLTYSMRLKNIFLKPSSRLKLHQVIRSILRGQYMGKLLIERFLNQTSPTDGLTWPAIMLNKVVFPAPFEPINPRVSPCSTWRSTLRSAWTPPKDFPTPLTFSKVTLSFSRSAIDSEEPRCRWGQTSRTWSGIGPPESCKTGEQLSRTFPIAVPEKPPHKTDHEHRHCRQ